MTTKELFEALFSAKSAEEFERAIERFGATGGKVTWFPLGARENNRGTVEASADPGRSLVERLTNGIDAVLETKHKEHRGLPLCHSPKEAAVAWLNVPAGGLSELTPAERRKIARLVTIKLREGLGRDRRTVEIIDQGVGLAADEMPRTILSLNESNKMQKHYLAGAYGQGGSSTFAACRYTLIASKKEGSTVGFTVVRYEDLPADKFKIGRYVYLKVDDAIPTADSSLLSTGTFIRHVEYDLSSYPSPLGPNSVYGLLNSILFDPVIPVWLDNEIHNYRRVIKGSRNALNGAVDEGDDNKKGPALSHSMPMFYVSLEDYGRIGIEYWVLDKATKDNKKPSAAFVNPAKPIVLSVNGQNHAEITSLLIRKEAELPYLTTRLICHIDCNSLTPNAKRSLFVSNREDVRRGLVYELIRQELVKALRSDDELARINNEAREHSFKQEDETAEQQMRSEVSKILRLHGFDVGAPVGGEASTPGVSDRVPTPRRPPKPPVPVDLREPPTYVKILWPEKKITLFAGQRRYVRLETDAANHYHHPNDPSRSRFNFIVSGGLADICGSTPLKGGRLRLIIEARQDAKVDASGTIRVELSRTGLTTLYDEREIVVVRKPETTEGAKRLPVPKFRWVPVTGPEDEMWNTLEWPENTTAVASSAVFEGGELVIYYSTIFPKYIAQRQVLERKDPSLAESYTTRYKIWLAVHSLLLYQDEQENERMHERKDMQEDPEQVADRERKERCRIATIAALVAAREMQLSSEVTAIE